ncbi:MAG TPA: hypothetical protein PLH48_17370 [Acinetobacter johnsonii]|nr:hypothetical protein [Acinetobacter johnsonii]
MAVSEQTPYIEYTANGITTSFALEFDCDNQDHLIVLVDDVEPVVGAWSLSNGAVVFNTAPENGKKITLQRNTPFSRTTDYQSYNNSFRPPAVNNDFDRVWWKLQELGLVDWLLSNRIDALKNYVDVQDADLQQNIDDLRLHSDQQDSLLQQNIENLKGYVDDKDDELRSYLLAEIQAQGVALDQLDEYYNYLMQRLAQIAVDGGWDASFVSYGGLNQKQVNDGVESIEELLAIPAPQNGMRVDVKSYRAGQGRGGDPFVWDATSTKNDDGGMVLKVPNIDVGRWKRITNKQVNPFMFGAYDGLITNTDSYLSTQKFFDYIAVNDVGTADAAGYFWVSQGLELNGAKRPIAGSQQIATMSIVGNPTYRALNGSVIDVMVKLYNCSELHWEGRINVRGTGSTSLASRTCRIGVQISRSGRSKFGGFKAENFSHFGVDINDKVGNTSAVESGEVITRMCGSGSRASGASLVASYSNREDYASTPSPTTNRSHLTVDVLPPEQNLGNPYRDQIFCRVGEVTYRIMEIDRETSKVSLFPIIAENADLTGQITYVYGGGVNIRGSDAGILGFGMIDATNCGIAVDMCSLYGPNIKRVISQNNGIGVCAGLRTNSAMVSYVIGSLYSEGNYVDIFHNTSAASDGGYFIGAEYALNLAKVEGTQSVFAIVKNGRYLSYEKPANNGGLGSSALTLSFSNSNLIRTYYKDAWTFTLVPPNIDLNRLFGVDSFTLVLIGSGTAGTPTGSFTFNIPTGWTVNGSTTPVVFSDFSGGPVIFSMYCLMASKDIKIACSSEVTKKNTSNVSAQSVAANSKYTQNVTIAGVSLGDDVSVAYTKNLNGLMLNAYVSATDTVTCEFINPTAAPIALEAGSLKLKITKF